MRVVKAIIVVSLLMCTSVLADQGVTALKKGIIYSVGDKVFVVSVAGRRVAVKKAPNMKHQKGDVLYFFETQEVAKVK